MNTIFDQILQLLVEPPGNLVYHLVVVFAILSALQGVLLNRNEGQSATARRLTLGFALLLAGQVILFISAALGWQRLIDPQVINPILDRTVILFSLVIIAWMWLAPQKHRAADIIAISLSLAAALFFMIASALWPQQTQFDYCYQSNLELFWTVAVSLIAAATAVFLAVTRKDLWGVGLGFFSLILAGSLIHWFSSNPLSDLPAALRLAMVCAFPMLPSLVKTMPTGSQSTELPVDAGSTSQLRRNQTAHPHVIMTWLQLARTNQPEKIGPAFTQAIGRSLLADLTFLATAPRPDASIQLQFGYDLIREEAVPGTSINPVNIPLIANALHRKKSVRLFAGLENPPNDIKVLSEVLGLNEPGNLLIAPLGNDEHGPTSIILLSPYSKYEWTGEDQALLQSICENGAELLSSADSRNKTRLENELLREELKNTRQSLALTNPQPQSQLQTDQPQESILLSDPGQPPLEVAGLLAIQKEAEITISRLEMENSSLREALRDFRADFTPVKDNEHIEQELRQSLEEVARLQNTLADANMRLLQVQQQVNQGGQFPGKDREILASVLQDLRQPISSILGYSDLLMTESVGILGSLQRKFLERIKASSDRMKSLLDDLMQTSAFSFSPIDLAPQPVSLDGVLDQAISDISALLREKDINLLMEIPDDLPRVFADRDALHQVIIHLLQNAGSATPEEGNISLRVQIQQTKPADAYLLFQVTDEGGGIPPQDLTRVFSRRYRSEHPPVPGVGDNGVGLSIAKTLVEAHGGRIWVESEPGKTSTFSILLPVRPSHNGHEILT